MVTDFIKKQGKIAQLDICMEECASLIHDCSHKKRAEGYGYKIDKLNTEIERNFEKSIAKTINAIRSLMVIYNISPRRIYTETHYSDCSVLDRAKEAGIDLKEWDDVNNILLYLVDGIKDPFDKEGTEGDEKMKYAYSIDGENYIGPYDSMKEARLDCIKCEQLEPGDEFYIAQMAKNEIKPLDIDMECLLEDITEGMGNNGVALAEDVFMDLDDNDRTELSKQIAHLINNYMEENIRKNCLGYTVLAGEAVTMHYGGKE